MRTPNHIAGGLVITGFCSALCGVNIFSSPLSIGVMVIASLLPDIDHPKSIIGRSLKPVALAINRRWGHRTLTHSAVALVCSTFLFALTEKGISGNTTLALVYFFAYFSHLLLDMVTLMGVPLLYPFSKNPFVMPANPKWRIRNDDRRAETIAFCLFILAGLFMRPLFEQGFWTTYNRTFGTLKHVVSEFHKADDLLEIAYTGKIGTEPVSGAGYCIEVTEQYAIILENDRFRRLDKESMVLNKLLPRHTGRKFIYEHLSIVNVSLDSLNRLVTGQSIAEVDLSSSQSFYILLNGHTTEQKRLHEKYLTDLIFLHPKDTLSIAASKAPPFFYEPNPRIPILEHRLEEVQLQNQRAVFSLISREREISELKQRIREAADMPTQERLYRQLETIRKSKPPTPELETERNLIIEIAQLKKQEQLKNLERQTKHTLQYQPELATPLLLSGQITFVTII
ncbi:MAG: metal-dependent hydrolase [Lewinella sp.]|nr:metal-dependent hydrolase [Lewinella sp.]